MIVLLLSSLFEGHLLRVGEKNYPLFSISIAELSTIWMRIKVSIYEVQIIELWVEGDSIIIIHCLIRYNGITSLHLLFQDLLSWKHTFLTLHIFYVLT